MNQQALEDMAGSECRLLDAIKASFGLEADQTISPTSTTTVKEFVKGFVRDRSRILHGTWSTLRANQLIHFYFHSPLRVDFRFTFRLPPLKNSRVASHVRILGTFPFANC